MSRLDRLILCWAATLAVTAIAAIPLYKMRSKARHLTGVARVSVLPGLLNRNPVGSASASPQSAFIAAMLRDRNPSSVAEQLFTCVEGPELNIASVISELTDADPAFGLECANQLAALKPGVVATSVYAAVMDSVWRQRGTSGLVAALHDIPDAGLRSTLLSRTVAMQAAIDPESTAIWLLELPQNVDRSESMTALSSAWAQRNPKEAADFSRQLPPGELRQRSLNAALDVWIRQDAVAASAWLSRLERSPELDHAVAEVARTPALTHARLDLALNWAESVVNESARKQSIGTVVAVWATRDLASSVHYVRTTPSLTFPQREALLEDLGVAESPRG